MTPEMRSFLTAWLEWANSPDRHCPYSIFSPQYGLCTNLSRYCKAHGVRHLDLNVGMLEEMFREDGRSLYYPFGEEDYQDRYYNFEQHLCPERLAWVSIRLKA